jgi:hypothetical protein
MLLEYSAQTNQAHTSIVSPIPYTYPPSKQLGNQVPWVCYRQFASFLAQQLNKMEYPDGGCNPCSARKDFRLDRAIGLQLARLPCQCVICAWKQHGSTPIDIISMPAIYLHKGALAALIQVWDITSATADPDPHAKPQQDKWAGNALRSPWPARPCCSAVLLFCCFASSVALIPRDDLPVDPELPAHSSSV